MVYDTLIFDIGDVIFTFSTVTTTSIPPKLLGKILHSASWFEYEKGKLSEADSYRLAAEQYGLDVNEVQQAFQCVRDSLTGRPRMVDLIRELKPGRKVYAMSNISAPDWEVLKTKSSSWDIFDHVFTSAAAGERKPNLGFYHHVLRETGADPASTIFVDDKHENLLSARSLGITTILYDSFENVERSLRNLCGNPTERAVAFLSKGARNHLSSAQPGQIIHDNFSQLLIHEATNDPTLVKYDHHDGLFNFFRGQDEMAATGFPADLNTTAVGLRVATGIDDRTKTRIMDDMLRYQTADNIIQVFFDHSRPRLDPVVCINVLTLFYLNGRGQQLKVTLDWIRDILVNRAYLHGTRYSCSADDFLFFLSHLLSVSPQVKDRLGSLFLERCREQIGAPGDALALGRRVYYCCGAGLDPQSDLEQLLSLQQIDGGWNDGAFCRYGSSDTKIQNRGLTTATALRAIETYYGAKARRTETSVVSLNRASSKYRQFLELICGYLPNRLAKRFV